jgi:hypothetical protein
MNMTTPRVYEDIDRIYRCVLLLLIDMSTNCARKLKLPTFTPADVHFFTCDFKICSNIQNSATQNNGLLLCTDLMIHGSKRACKNNCIQVPNYT